MSGRWSVVVAGLACVAAAGCNRATRGDCEQIVDRIVELELKEQGVTDPKAVAQRKAEIRERKRDQLVKDCEGKRLPPSAMECVRKAETSRQVTEECLR